MTARHHTKNAVTAIAHPNIALIKYWGKADVARNLPATGSISITLDSLGTTTSVAISDESEGDRFSLNGQPEPAMALRLFAFLDAQFGSGRPRLDIASSNNFPTAAGLASSASGFAALVVATNELLQSGHDRRRQAQIAGAGSGSAARSLFGGFVRLDKPSVDDGDIEVRPLLGADEFPLSVVVAITEEGRKPLGSTEAMIASRETSPYYQHWLSEQEADLEAAEAAIFGKDFEALAYLSENSCMKMHAVMQTTRPSLLYWNAATVACMHAVAGMREQGLGVFYTIDAGPQVKAICLPQDRENVARTLADVPGVKRILKAGLGGGARVARGDAADG